MATRKKKVVKKAAPKAKKPRVNKAPAKKLPEKKPVAKKAPTTKRRPPMHAKLVHQELAENDTERDETFEIFKSFDRDGSGSIDRAELARLLEALGQNESEEELSIALDAIDLNHSGRISWDEFKAWWSAR